MVGARNFHFIIHVKVILLFSLYVQRILSSVKNIIYFNPIFMLIVPINNFVIFIN